MKVLVACLCALLLALQWRLWFGEGSLQQVARLSEEARGARAAVLRLRTRDRELAAEVTDLKSGLEAIEERARTELGMVGGTETFYRFVGERATVGTVAREGGTERAADLPDADGDVELIDPAAGRASGGGTDGAASDRGASGDIRRVPRVE